MLLPNKIELTTKERKASLAAATYPFKFFVSAWQIGRPMCSERFS